LSELAEDVVVVGCVVVVVCGSVVVVDGSVVVVVVDWVVVVDCGSVVVVDRGSVVVVTPVVLVVLRADVVEVVEDCEVLGAGPGPDGGTSYSLTTGAFPTSAANIAGLFPSIPRVQIPTPRAPKLFAT
jgi:hypothetical protein